MSCPKCGSNNITTNNKGYGIGKGIIGTMLIGPLGLLAGNIGKHDIKCTCLDCGHQWDLKTQIQQQEFNKIVTTVNNAQEENPEETLEVKTILIILTIIIILFFMFKQGSNDTSKISYNNDSSAVSQQSEKNISETSQTRTLFSGSLTTSQIDNICTTSLGELNCNNKSNYTRVSSNQNNRKYIYRSKESGYDYECRFTSNNQFYINGVGWQDIIPKGTIYNGKTKGEIYFELYDPGFKLTHNFTISK